MTLYCRYHVLEPADWRCQSCHIDFCSTCSPDPVEEDSSMPRKCPHCKGLLQPLAAAYNAPPFWQRLTAFLRYPFSPVAGVLMFLAFLIPLVVPDGVLLNVARLGFLLPLTVYLWAVFERVVTGDVEPIGPKVLASTAGRTPLPLYLGVALAVLAGAGSFAAATWGFAGKVLVSVLLGLLPALLAGVARTRSVGSGFSKDGVVTVVTGVGPVYAAVFLMPILLVGGLLAFVSLFTDVLPNAVGYGLDMAAYTYAAIVIFALSAYMLFQYQEELDYTPEGDSGKRKSYRRVDPVQSLLEMHLKDGNYGKAITILKMDVDKKSATVAQHERYHKLIWALNHEEDLKAHAVPYFKALLANGRGVQAAQVFRNYLQRYPDFKLAEPEVRLDLAQAFEQQGDFKLAVHVLNGLHKDSAQFPGLPEAYLLAARLLAEQLKMPQKALALVQFLHGRYRNHRLFPEINRMAQELSRSAPAAP
ncbi:MAG TPA: tetratricopeptide repeat protein [Moraxellaceae bacterium]|nr:tetratricopeptide repeat protein [Moraxellaceae bacterium]